MKSGYQVLKKGDRVMMKLEHQETGEVREFFGTCTGDEVFGFDWVSVDWDDSEMSSLFASNRMFLVKVDDE